MIQLTRLNGSRFAINPDLVKFLEEAPDTVITLVTGEKLVVRESAEQIMERIAAYRRAISPARCECSNKCEGFHG